MPSYKRQPYKKNGKGHHHNNRTYKTDVERLRLLSMYKRAQRTEPRDSDTNSIGEDDPF